LKKLLAFTLLFFLAAPATSYAYDFGTAGYIAAVGTTAIGVAALAGAAPALATLAIGAAVMGITFDKTEATGSPIVVQVSPAAKLQTPTGWTAPVSGSSNPTPPASVPASTGWYLPGVHLATVDLVCKAYYAGYTGISSVQTTPTIGNCLQNGVKLGNNVYPENICAAGYTYNTTSAACSLSNAALVMKPSDGACGIKRSGNTFSEDPQDPDCGTGKPATVSISSNQITQTKSDGSSKTVTINPDGSTTATETRPDTATNTTQVNTTNIAAPDASGNASVNGQGSGATNGTGTANNGQTVPTFDKSGLATEGTLSAIKDALTNSGTADGTLTSQKTALDSAASGSAGLITGETGKSEGWASGFSFGGYLPQSCGCQPLSATYHGHTASFDWCPAIDKIRSVLAWVFGILAAFTIFSFFKVPN
jgi:hypothetical protein